MLFKQAAVLLVFWSSQRADGSGDEYFDQGLEFLSSGREIEAIVAFRSALALDPARPSLWHCLGSALGRLGGSSNEESQAAAARGHVLKAHVTEPSVTPEMCSSGNYKSDDTSSSRTTRSDPTSEKNVETIWTHGDSTPQKLLGF